MKPARAFRYNERMRVFIAINFDEETRSHLEACCNRLLERTDASAPVPRENFHLTLAFLGDIDEDALFVIEDALDDIANPLENELVFDHAGAFGSSRTRSRKERGNKAGARDSAEQSSERTWWMGIQPNEQLNKLQRAIQTTLEKLGFSFEARDYTPHVTLARRVTARAVHDDRGAVASTAPDTSAGNKLANDELARFVAGQPFTAQVNSFSLMESRNTGTGVAYEEICAWE